MIDPSRLWVICERRRERSEASRTGRDAKLFASVSARAASMRARRTAFRASGAWDDRLRAVCHADGRGFEPLQPPDKETPAKPRFFVIVQLWGT
jgi:hypothetical protein